MAFLVGYNSRDTFIVAEATGIKHCEVSKNTWHLVLCFFNLLALCQMLMGIRGMDWGLRSNFIQCKNITFYYSVISAFEVTS